LKNAANALSAKAAFFDEFDPLNKLVFTARHILLLTAKTNSDEMNLSLLYVNIWRFADFVCDRDCF